MTCYSRLLAIFLGEIIFTTHLSVTNFRFIFVLGKFPGWRVIGENPFSIKTVKTRGDSTFVKDEWGSI